MRKFLPALTRLAAGVCCLALGSCSMNFTRPIPVEHITIELDSGITYEDQIAGLGAEAELGDVVELHYEAWLEDGQAVDSSVERGVPISFTLGEAPIEGWNEALTGMSAGGRRRMTIPAALAYGEAGVPGLVPPDAPLSFEIQLRKITKPDATEPDAAESTPEELPEEAPTESPADAPIDTTGEDSHAVGGSSD